MKHIFIINPSAGKKARTEKLENDIAAVCAASGADFAVYKTESDSAAAKLISDAAASRGDGETLRFYSCGGDGTLCRTVSAAIGLENVEVAVIPIGSGNDFLRNFTDLPAFSDIKRQLDGKSLPIDVISCNGLYAVNMINIGFDGDVVEETANTKKLPGLSGSLAYYAGVVRVLFRKLGKRMKVTLDGAPAFDGQRMLILAANGSFCGGGFMSAPDADMRDGYLDVVVARMLGRARFIRYIGDYKAGTYKNSPLGKYLDTSRAKSIVAEFDEKVNISVDGEIIKSERAEIGVLPLAISLSLPYGVDFIPRGNGRA